MLSTIADVLARRIAGQTLTAAELEAALTKRDKLPQPTTGGVALIPIHGVIIPRGTMFSEVSGATTVEALSSQLRAALAAEEVSTIVLDVDSPGGNAAGITEFAREIMRARTKKPVIAVAQYTMASAAYWLAAAATEIVASPSASVGSVGVYTIHDDLSKALAEFGVKRTYISAGKFKVDGNETEPLSDSALEFIQGRVDDTYSRFVTDIASGRGISKEIVKSDFGQGRTLSADDALAAKMIDSIATLDETIARLVGAPKKNARGARAEIDTLPLSAADTSQEPARVTDQDRHSDARWRAAMETQFLSASL